MKYIDNFLNGITMYKLVLFGLSILFLLSLIGGFTGILDYSPYAMLLSYFVLISVCYVSNWIFSLVFKVQTNVESSFITALILYFTLIPISSFYDLNIFLLAGVIAMGSKYIFAINKKHIFNPVAITLVILSLFGSGLAGWWVGSMAMLLPVSILGFLVLRKVKRFQMFGIFAGVATVVALISATKSGGSAIEALNQLFVSGPLVFFGTIILTEPLTTPPQRNRQIIYGSLSGLFYSLVFSIGPLSSSPALALFIANMYSYLASPRARLLLELKEKNKLSADVYEFVWKILNSDSNRLQFKAGQYLEWTLGHDKPDLRGNRRYFTIASSPTEEGVRLGVKFYPNSSSFKNKLVSLQPGSQIIASQLAGDFTLPQDTSKKLVFIAGGIGITPFRAMVKSMIDNQEKREVTLFFSNKTVHDVVYKEYFDEAERSFGMKTVYVVNDATDQNQLPLAKVGMINSEMIMNEVPDYKERMFYISGTHGMVTAFEDQLKKMGVPRNQIKIDFFPGFV